MKKFVKELIICFLLGACVSLFYDYFKDRDKIAMLENNLKACNQLLGESK